MGDPTTTYKGFDINFREWDECWFCAALEKKNESLPKLKKAIDQWDRKIRKSSAVEAMTLSVDLPKLGGSGMKERGQGDAAARFQPFKVVEYLGSSWRSPVTLAAMPEGGSRRHINMTNLIRKSSENQDVLDRANAIAGDIWPMLNRFWMVLDELEYLEEKDVADLKEIHEREPKEE